MKTGRTFVALKKVTDDRIRDRHDENYNLYKNNVRYTQMWLC